METRNFKGCCADGARQWVLWAGLSVAAIVTSCASPASHHDLGTFRGLGASEPPPLPLKAQPSSTALRISGDQVVPTIGSDLKGALPAIGSDLVDVYSTPSVWWTLAASYAGGEALDLVNTEREVSRYFAHHSLMPDGVSRGFDELGKGYVLLAGAGAWYLLAKDQQDSEAIRSSQHLLRCLASTGISTLVFKTAFSDQRPNGGGGAYPSGHASMTAATATSLWLTQGPKVGVPAAILAGLVDIQRLDSKAHELDDIIGGATLGWIVAYTLYDDKAPEVLGARVLPAFSPSGDPGISLLWSY